MTDHRLANSLTRKKKDRTSRRKPDLSIFCTNANVANRGASNPRPADAPARDATKLLRGSLGRGRGLLFHRGGGVSATTASTTIASAIAAAVATAVAAAVMAAIAVVATTAAVAAVAATIAAAAATTTMTEGHRLVVTAQEGDTDDREENRETKNNNTVHSQILQLLTGTGK